MPNLETFLCVETNENIYWTVEMQFSLEFNPDVLFMKSAKKT